MKEFILTALFATLCSLEASTKEVKMDNTSKRYTKIEISFGRVTSDVNLSGTLTLPYEGGNFPAVILIPGSGVLNRDSEFQGHKPFQIIADHLSSKGVAVLRFDKRGVGKSTGDFAEATIENLAQDVLDAIDYIKSRKEINRKKIGLIGHNEGGLIASMVGSSSSDVSFVVMLAGPSLPVKENVSLCFSLLVNEETEGSGDFNSDKKVFDRFFNIVTKKDICTEEKKDAIDIASKMLPRITEASKGPLGIAELSPDVFITIFSMVPCIQGFLDSDPEVFLADIKCPLLAVYGENDVQVPAKENIRALKKILKKAKNKNYQIKEIHDLNHLFQKCKTGYPSEYLTIKETMVSEVLDCIFDWISDKTT